MTARDGGPRVPHVSLVLVSHSAAAARGTAEIAAQMAPDVTVLAAGGTDDDSLGTSVDRVLDAVREGLDRGPEAGVVVLTDLGSAILTTDAVLELLDAEEEGLAARVRVPSAPFVEAAVSAAVAAQQGGDLDAVDRAAVEAGLQYAAAAGQGPADDRSAPPSRDATAAAPPGDGATPGVPDGSVTAQVVVRNPLGLHARPAALLARAVSDCAVPLTVNGANGASVLELMALGATGGQELTVVAHGDRAQEGVDLVVGMVEGGFGET